MSKIKLNGTSLNEFAIGNSATTDVKLVNTSTVLEVKDTSNAFQYVRVKKVNDNATPNTNDVATYYDVAGKIVSIGFNFAGGDPPSAGVNTGLYGFCHTSGGAFTAGYVYYDNGSTLARVIHVSHITSTTAVTGTISLNANGIYALDSGTWVLKGDGSGGGEPTGTVKTIKVPFAYTDTSVSSTTSITDGAIITRVDVVKTQAFNGTAPTLSVILDGTSNTELMGTTDIDLTSTVQDTSLELVSATSSNEGVITLTVTTSGASAGTGFVLVSYCLTQNA